MPDYQFQIFSPYDVYDSADGVILKCENFRFANGTELTISCTVTGTIPYGRDDD